MEGCENDFWTLVCVKIMHVQIFGPVEFVVLAVEGKTGSVSGKL